MQYVDSNTKVFQAGGALGQYLRVKLVAGVLALAGAADIELGVMLQAAFAAGDRKSVMLRNKQGTMPMVAVGAIAAGAVVYTDANGQVGTTNTNTRIGVAITAASGAGSILEVLRD